MSYRHFIFFILVLLAFMSKGVGQTTYPVQVNAHLLPPYSLYLSDYYSSSREKLTITLINRDQFKPTLNVRLRMIITGPGGIRIQTNESSFITPVIVETGAPVRLSQEDIAPYFQPQNIISQGYLPEGRLPEGMVEFCFQAIEAYTGQVLSASTCARAWITSQKPPLLSLPQNKESIAFREPLNVLFQWTPLHQGLAQVEYEFILKELWDNGMTPQAAFPYSAEIYRETVRGTSLIYNAMHPPLLPGKRYMWCVRAQAREGLDALNLFQNDGYSEVRWFTLQDNCNPLTLLRSSAERKRLTVEWDALPEHIGFTISYRLKSTDNTNAEWKEQQTPESQVVVQGLKNGGTYEYRVGSLCMSGIQPVYSPIFAITLPEADSARLAQCGIMPAINLTNQEPIKELKTGEVIMANDFPMTITRISGSNGVFSGEGWVVVPWLNDAKIAVQFTSITINTDRQMINGFIDAKYDKTEGQIANLDDIFEGGFDVGTVKSGLTNVDYKFDYSIPGVESFSLNDNGELAITDTGGTPHTVLATDKEGQGNEGNNVVVFPMTVQDKDGNVYQVEKVTQTDATGKEVEVAKATYLGKVGAALAEGSFNPTQLDGDKAIVTFAKGTGQYAFDSWENYYDKVSLIKEKYQKLYTDYYAPWKLLPAGQSDNIRATITITDQSIKPELVIFKTPAGTEYKAVYDSGTYILTVASGPVNDVQEVYALYPVDKDKYYTLGKIGIATYASQNHKVVLVSVNGAVADKGIEQKLRDVYGPVGVTYQVVRDQFEYNQDSIRLMQNSTGLSTYNAAMRSLNNAYRESHTYDPSTNYLFFLKATGADKINNRDATGFMPRGAQYGYIFTSEIPDAYEAVAVAHELGHGRYKLYHTFDKHYGEVEGSHGTSNLMDYNNGEHIAKWQWDQMNDPAMLVSIFESDEKNAFVVENSLIADASWSDQNSVTKSVFLYGDKKIFIKFKAKQNIKGKTIHLRIEDVDPLFNNIILEKDYYVNSEELNQILSFDYDGSLFSKGDDLEQQLIFKMYIDKELHYHDANKVMKTHGVVFVPVSMHALGLTHAEELQKIWFSGTGVNYPWESSPQINLLSLDWIISAPRFKVVYDDVVSSKWKTTNALNALKEEINDMIADKVIIPPTSEKPETEFGTFNTDLVSKLVDKDEVDEKVNERMPIIEKYYNQSILFNESKGSDMDDHYATIGDCSFRVASKGALVYDKASKQIEARITHIAIYVRDNFDYVESTLDQPLGYWNFKVNQVSKGPLENSFFVQNSDYRKYRTDTKKGMDYYWFSDIKIIDVTASNIIIKL